MGVKGISWIEQNVEKIVVAVFGAGLLGVIALQFVGGSTTIKITGADKKPASVPIEEAMTKVGDQARLVHERITAPDPRELEEIQGKVPAPSGVQETFAQRLGNVAPRPQLAAALDTPRLRLGESTPGAPRPGAQSFMYAQVKPAAPEKPVGMSYIGTVHPLEYTGKADVAAILPRDPEPKDKAAVSIETTFDGLSLAQVLQTDPDGEGPLSALPAHWWSGENIQILAVNLERQELKADGTWSEPTKVAPMPGRPNLATEIQKIAGGNADGMKALMSAARSQASEIRRPRYYEVVFGEAWLPPNEAIALLASDALDGVPADDSARAKRELEEKDNQIARLQEEHRKIEESGNRQPAVDPRAPASGGGKGSSGTPTPPGSGGSDAKTARLKRIDDQIANRFKERDRIIEKWRARGVELAPETMAPKAPMIDPGMDSAATEVAELPLLDNARAKILAHDVWVGRGKTYRYRVWLTLNNPVFGRVVANTPEQEALTKQAFIETAPSEWSAPVEVEAETYYFVTSASAQDAISRGSRASADVFIFRWGYWRKGNVSIEPGDILVTDVKVPDLSKQLAMMNLPGGMEPMMDPRDGGRGGRGGQVAPPATQFPSGPTPPGQPGMGDWDKAEVMYKQESVSHNAIMLDVAPTAVLNDPTAARPKLENHVFLQDSNGAITVRSPDVDKSSTEYRRLELSSRRGEEALKPKIINPIGDPNAPMRPPEEPSGKGEPPPPGGGGG